MSTLPDEFPSYTVEDYIQWKGDWELWDGVPIAMSPSPFGLHQVVAGRIITQLNIAIDAAGCQAVVASELDWIVSDDTVVRPDVMIICGEPPQSHQRETPAVIFEVLSISTEKNDRGFKQDLYHNQGVELYFVVDPQNRTVELLQPGKSMSPQNGQSQINICKNCKLDVNLDSFFSNVDRKEGA